MFMQQRSSLCLYEPPWPTEGEKLINGDIVAWLDWRHFVDPQDKDDLDDAEVYARNLKTGKEARVTFAPGRGKDNLRVWGDNVFVEMQLLESDAYEPNAVFVCDLPTELR